MLKGGLEVQPNAVIADKGGGGGGLVRFPDSDCPRASFVHWMGKPQASESGPGHMISLVIILASAFPESLLLPP